MSKVFAEYSSTGSAHSAYNTFVAAIEMGHQHSRAIDNSTRKLQIRRGGGGIFHKVDRGEASSQYNSNRA
jgi:hypothetical protein